MSLSFKGLRVLFLLAGISSGAILWAQGNRVSGVAGIGGSGASGVDCLNQRCVPATIRIPSGCSVPCTPFDHRMCAGASVENAVAGFCDEAPDVNCVTGFREEFAIHRLDCFERVCVLGTPDDLGEECVFIQGEVLFAEEMPDCRTRSCDS